MTMQVKARVFTTGSEVIKARQELRARFDALKPPPPKPVVVEPDPRIYVPDLPVFYEHVFRYRWYVSRFQGSPARFYIYQRCEEMSWPLQQIMSRKQNRVFTFPRQLLMYELHQRFDMSLPEIGRIFNRDHTTVLHAHRKIQRMIDEGIELWPCVT